MKYMFLLSSFMIFSGSHLYASARSEINKGNKEYKNEEHEKALEHYRSAQMMDPNEPIVNFDMGNALYRTEKYEEADNEYIKASGAEDPNIAIRSLYNLGNSSYRQGNSDEAIEYYKKVLDMDPNEINAKYNIEYIKAEKCNPCQKDQKQDKDDKGKDQKNKKGKKEKEKEGNDDKKEDTDKEKGKDAGEKEENNKMSKEDAQRILQYYSDAEKNAAKKRKMKLPQAPEVEQDW